MSDAEEPKRKTVSRKDPVELVTAPTPVTPITHQRVYRFEQWASRKGIALRHRGGMRAFVSNADMPRTLEAWDACFQAY